MLGPFTGLARHGEGWEKNLMPGIRQKPGDRLLMLVACIERMPIALVAGKLNFRTVVRRMHRAMPCEVFGEVFQIIPLK